MKYEKNEYEPHVSHELFRYIEYILNIKLV